MEKKEMEQGSQDMLKLSKEISRKSFLKGMGKTIAGFTVLGGVGTVLAGCSADAAAGVTASAAPAWPFEYEKIDADKAAQRAYDSYKSGRG